MGKGFILGRLTSGGSILGRLIAGGSISGGSISGACPSLHLHLLPVLRAAYHSCPARNVIYDYKAMVEGVAHRALVLGVVR